MRRQRHSDIHGVHKLTYSNTALLPDEVISGALAPYGWQPSAGLADAIREYVQLLLRWNRKVSLTTIREPVEILQRHFGEATFGARQAQIEQGDLVDVGSGAGFPALPIKLIAPDVAMTLIEANHKKAAFLAEVVRALGLGGVEVVTKRTAELKDFHRRADFVTSRAVRPDKRLLEWMHSALRSGGKCVLWLGSGDAAAVTKLTEWKWKKPAEIPLSKNRVVLVGQVGRF